MAAFGLILLLYIASARDTPDDGPDREPLPATLARVHYEALHLDTDKVAPFRLSGAWKVTVDTPRFAGLSGLAVTQLGLLGLTDSGAVVDLPKPGSRAVTRVRDLPSGPGWPTYKRFRDSESLSFDMARQGWWIGFEHRHSLWFFDGDFSAGKAVIGLADQDWLLNKGLEGVVAQGDRVLLFPERGRQVLSLGKLGRSEQPLLGATGDIADAIRLPDGRILITMREIGLHGITNRLAWLKPARGGYQVHPIAALPLGPFDNVEGLAAERLPNGDTRVWAVTDNDGWRRTLLIALDLPARKRPPAN
jgi:hypothetical protein